MKHNAILVAVSLVAAACGDPQADATPSPAPPTGDPILIESIPSTLPVAGTVKAGRRAEISTRLMARVTRIMVDVGDSVRSGQMLAVLGSDDVAASLASARASVTAAQAARDEARRQLQRMETLLEQDAVPAVQRDAARLQAVQAESGYSVAVAGLARAESQQRYSELRAPFAGTVAQRTAEVGDVAAPGVPLLVLEDLSREGVAHVPVEVIPSLRIGTQLSVNRSGSGRDTPAVITRIAAGADQATRTVEIRFTLPADWITGAPLTVVLPQGAHDGIGVRENEITRRGQLTGVRIATESGVQIRWVRLGKSYVGNDSIVHFEVLSGLEPGDRIVQ